MADDARTNPSIDQSEHDDTGSAKRVLPVMWNGSGYTKLFTGMFTKPYDDLVFSNADANGNYQTLNSKLAGVTQETYSLSYDASSNLTRFHRTS